MEQLLQCGVNIPWWHYDSHGHLLDTNSNNLVLDKILEFIGGIEYALNFAQKDSRPLILSGDMNLLWCAVFEKKDAYLQGIWLIGPVLHGEISHAFIDESVERYHIDGAFQRQYRKILHDLSVVPSIMLMQYGLMLHYCVTGEQLQHSDIQFQAHSALLSPLPQETESSQSNYAKIFDAQQALLRMIREGDRNYKKVITDAQSFFRAIPGSFGPSLTTAIIRATGFANLCIREAILAGISPDTAYGIGEGYIESMAQCHAPSELPSLLLAMFEDFVYRVYKHRKNPSVSTQIQSCKDYIELHPDRELKLEHLAKQVGYSEYYLSRKFKKEMGVPISTYIKYVRVERSKLMLTSTSLSIAQIADMLNFASSSHYSETFREVIGKTPQQYRTENLRY
jgi:AraC-like DNA-binding protein